MQLIQTSETNDFFVFKAFTELKFNLRLKSEHGSREKSIANRECREINELEFRSRLN